MTTSLDVRREIVDALCLDLVGPGVDLGDPAEMLGVMPSIFYRTGFLVPIEAEEAQKIDETVTDEVDSAPAGASADENEAPESTPARRAALPSSLGLSLLVSAATKVLTVTVNWGDYRLQSVAEGETGSGTWKRIPCSQTLAVEVPAATRKPKERDVPAADGLRIAIAVRPIRSAGGDGELPTGTRSVSLFLVNRRKTQPDLLRDQASAFQAELEVSSIEPFVPRPNVRNLADGDWDERVADLQFRDACEFAVGHGISTQAEVDPDCHCRRIRTCWIAESEVERVAAAQIKGVTLEMEMLAELRDGADAQTQLGQIVTSYQAWIQQQQAKAPTSPPQRKMIANDLLKNAEVAAKRIGDGIAALHDEQVLAAFKLANKVMAASARQRFGVIEKTPPEKLRPPAWRPFQIAFVLMNLPGIADPTRHDREVVDLLFFPTGGGKTEAYLGLAAFTLILRRLRKPGISSSGLAVLMRYTLRLLTLDQLSRASTLICALELERRQDVTRLGDWPFEIGLWVGKAATPNAMGQKGDNREDTARKKTIAYKRGTSSAPPIPLENCPWCGEKFEPNSFRLIPNEDQPTDLRILCLNRDCKFCAAQNPGDKSFRGLPVLAVDEPIYRRLPCFMIATVDKFAAMPWTGQVGAFFGKVQRCDNSGFYGPCDPGAGRPLPEGRLPPPDLVIQDELHLISGPLGTMVGLYESALEALCGVRTGDKWIRPKIVASTATVRRADAQIRSLFAREFVDVFPPPGPDRRDSFFARTQSAADSPARLYIGIAAQGRSPKVLMLKVYVILLAAAQKAYQRLDKKGAENPADPYMTLLGYFNSLRELGGARRIVEDEVGSALMTFANRKRVGETAGSFENRRIAYDVVELTSRVPTDKVSEAKRRLAQPFAEKDRVDVAIATNMISVGLDITRLGLMVVYGQPKTCAEYIQATSRVGREVSKPGLVVTILNIHRPRDRSHYERFASFHETFYRSVEATSVTPFSPRALDRGLAGTLVAMVRHSESAMTPPRGASEITRLRPSFSPLADVLIRRAELQMKGRDAADRDRLRERIRRLVGGLLDDWAKIAADLSEKGVALQYQKEEGPPQRLLYTFLDPEVKLLPARQKEFRANRSLRDVEPSVNLWVKTMDGIDVEEDEE